MFLLDVRVGSHCVLHPVQQIRLGCIIDIHTFNRFSEGLQRRLVHTIMALHNRILNLALEVIHTQLAIVKVEFVLGLGWLVVCNVRVVHDESL